MLYKRNLGSWIFDILNYLFMFLVIAVMLYPFLYVIALSLSDPTEIYAGKVSIFPRGWNTEGYTLILTSPQLWIAYKNTIIYAALSTVFTLFFTSLMAYPLSIRDFVAKKFITIFLAITMFFGGGMIPTYLLMRNIGILNTVWVMVIPSCVSAFNVIIFRTFFQGMSSELRESAHLDGANDIIILFKIYLPLSKALLATFALFTIVGQWNSYFQALIYLNEESKYPIQMILRKILFISNANQANEMAETMIQQKIVHPKNIQMAVIVVTIVPILCVYPFLQKYFAKGVMIGSLKG